MGRSSSRVTSIAQADFFSPLPAVSIIQSLLQNAFYVTEISNKLCDSTLCTCGGVGGVEEQMHNVDYDPEP